MPAALDREIGLQLFVKKKQTFLKRQKQVQFSATTITTALCVFSF